MSDQHEIWKDVVGYEGYYQVSNLGRVKSMPRSWVSGGYSQVKRSQPERIRKLAVGKRGYMLTALCKDGVAKTRPVHRLVAESFIPNPGNKSEVNHINGITGDNLLSNLEWATASENQMHALKLGLSVPCKGEAHGRSKLKEHQVLDIRGRYAAGERICDLMKTFSVARYTVEQIIKRKLWSHI